MDALEISINEKQPTFVNRIITIWLFGIVILLPVNIINLPLNMTPADFWIIAGLPVVWFVLIKGEHPVTLSYSIAMWIIILSSLASTIGAANPVNSLVLIMKEIYVYIWFITVVALVTRLTPGDYRRVMTVWTITVLLHGILIIAQFLSPDLWWKISGFSRTSATYEIYRPSGLFLCDTAGCANRAAFFQLLGFVPLALSGFSKKWTLLLGVLVLSSILATGSMGATLAFICGLTSTILAVAIFKKRMYLVLNYFFRIGIAVVLLGGIAFAIISQNQRYQTHIKSIVIGRAGRSSEGRFALWERGIDVLVTQNLGLWGIGPNNFRVIDWLGKQLHNDLLAFLVERGIVGVVGLIIFALIALSKSINLMIANQRMQLSSDLSEVVFLAAIMATIFESLTHQIFHDRQFWFVLALLEAKVFQKFYALEMKSAVQASLRVRIPNPELAFRPDVQNR